MGLKTRSEKGQQYLRGREVCRPGARAVGVLAPGRLGLARVAEVHVAVEAGRRRAVGRLGVEGRAVEVPDRGVEGDVLQVLAGAVRAHQRDELVGREALGLEQRHEVRGVVAGAGYLVRRVGRRAVDAPGQEGDQGASRAGGYSHGWTRSG